MAKQRKSRTANFNFSKPAAKLPSIEEVNQKAAKATGKVIKPKPTPKPKPVAIAPEPAPPVVVAPLPVQVPVERVTPKRVPLTTAIIPELRARLEVASIGSDKSVADFIQDALQLYFAEVHPAQDPQLLQTFTTIYGKKAK